MIDTFLKSPASEAVRLIAYDKAQVVPGIVPETWILIVSGEKPCVNMDVQLIPRIYIDKPDYWGIEVTGYVPGGICLTAVVPYTAELPLDGVIGKKGIEVIGANKQEEIDVPPGRYGKTK